METVKADDKKRIRIPDVEPGQVFAYELTASGGFLLTPVKKADAKARPFDRHMYDDLHDGQIELESASARADVSTEERDRE
jgi:hypothetical protein